MPEVRVELEINAPIEQVWETVVDIESYPRAMESVRTVRIVEQSDAEMRIASWSVLLKGSVLEWEEEERLDPRAHTIVFKQLRGDLEHFDGHWALTARGAGETHISFVVLFEIGIPLLAEMLNPVAVRSLHENCTEMLRGIEEQATLE